MTRGEFRSGQSRGPSPQPSPRKRGEGKSSSGRETEGRVVAAFSLVSRANFPPKSNAGRSYIQMLLIGVLRRENLFGAPLSPRAKPAKRPGRGWRRDATPNDHTWLPPCEE
jgi:hypothetical protein